MNYLKPTLIALCLLLSQIAQAEYFKHIGFSRGLSQLSVVSIYEDKLGRMWFGTKEGINVYDGSTIISYRSYIENHSGKQEKMLLGNNIYAIEGNSKGDIFLIADNALLKYDLQKEVFQTLVSQKVYSLDSYKGDVWCTISDSIFTYNAETNELDFVSKTSQDSNNWLTVTETTFFISHKNGLTAIDRKNGKNRSVITGIEVYRTFESSQKELWIGCLSDGLYRMAPDGEITKVPYSPNTPNGISSHQIREFTEDKFHNIWFGTFDGLQKYDLQTGEYSLIKLRKSMGGLEHPSIFSIYKDRKGTIWIGTYYGGVNYFSPDKTVFSHYNYEPNAGKDLYFSYIGEMVEDKDDNLWLATDGGGISCMDRKTHSFTNFRADSHNALPHNNVKSISYDNKRQYLYIGTHMGGLSRYDLKQKTFYNYLDHPHPGNPGPGNVIFHIQFWKDRLYISARNGFFILNPDTNVFEQIKMPSNYCLNFDLDEDGYIWATFWSRIARVNLEAPHKVTFIDLKEYGCPFEATKIKVTQQGIYAGTLGSGLFYYNKSTREVTNFTMEKEQLLSNYCYNISETKQGNILITSDKGITLFYPSSQTFRSVGLSSGFPAPAIMNGCGIFVSSNNEIFVGDVKGITSFRENDLRVLNEEQNFYFSKLSVNNQPIYPDDETGILSKSLPFIKKLNLKYTQNNLTISFALSNYVDMMQKGWYEYKLEGFDKQWIPTKHMSLHYTNLDPGNYVLHIRAKGKNPNTENKEISLQIQIASPWYNTIWAWLIYASVVFSCIVYYIRIQTAKKMLALSLEKERFEKQQIEQLNQAKLLFFTNVSHEFRTPLTLIISHIELLLQHTSIPPTFYNHILKINKHAQQMRNLVSELLDFRKFDQNHVVLKIGEHNLATFIREIYLSFLDYAHQRNITYLFNCNATHIDCWFDAQQLEKVIFNLLSNAFKYTSDKGKIEITIQVTVDKICIQVRDDGTGIETKESKRVFERFYQASNEQQATEMSPGTGIGLALTKSIVDKHHGNIFVESEIGQGSTFTVSLLKGKDHFTNDTEIQFIDQKEDITFISSSMPLLGTDSINDEKEEILQLSENAAYTLLIVEDNEDLLMVLKRLFEPFYKIRLAHNGKEGLEITIDEKPDLIISDVMMPEMTGTEMCLQIKNNIDLCHIPVILLTALNTTEQNIEGLNRGADDYIAKPFNAKILLARCNNLLRNRLLMQQQFERKPISEIDLTAINPLDKELLKRAARIIDQNMDDPEFDIPALCKELGLGRTLLYSKFKALTGMTPNNFILNHKLKCAAIMLRQHPELQIAEISDRLGFGSSVYFSRCFKGQFNMSPQNYRKTSEEP